MARTQIVSPFPGMDPYLEGHLWPDVHSGLAFTIKEQLIPQVVPKYLVHTNIYTVKDASPGEDIGILYPDVEVMKKQNIVREPVIAYGADSATPFTPATLTLPALAPIEVKIPVVEIRDKKSNELITAVEILSPVNKRIPNLASYRKKRHELFQSGIHLLEIDLLRRGQRPVNYEQLADKDYLVTLVRANTRKTDIWGMTIQEKLPIVPIPLKTPDRDIVLDIGQAFKVLYERSAYGFSIDYQEQPPPPAFSEKDKKWMKQICK